LETPSAPNPERTSRLADMTATTNTATINAMQAMMVQMQNTLQQQLQRQQNEFEVRIESLLIGKGKAAEIPSTSSSTVPKQPVETQTPPVIVRDIAFRKHK
jgi:hypothetical protein